MLKSWIEKVLKIFQNVNVQWLGTAVCLLSILHLFKEMFLCKYKEYIKVLGTETLWYPKGLPKNVIAASGRWILIVIFSLSGSDLYKSYNASKNSVNTTFTIYRKKKKMTVDPIFAFIVSNCKPLAVEPHKFFCHAAMKSESCEERRNEIWPFWKIYCSLIDMIWLSASKLPCILSSCSKYRQGDECCVLKTSSTKRLFVHLSAHWR